MLLDYGSSLNYSWNIFSNFWLRYVLNLNLYYYLVSVQEWAKITPPTVIAPDLIDENEDDAVAFLSDGKAAI